MFYKTRCSDFRLLYLRKLAAARITLRESHVARLEILKILLTALSPHSQVLPIVSHLPKAELTPLARLGS